MSKQFQLTLTNGVEDRIVYFDLLDTSIASKWADEVAKDYDFFETGRFTNWPNGKNMADFYQGLKEQIDIVNEYRPDTIVGLSHIFNQELLNYLHKFFEDLRGPVDNPADFYATAPDSVKEAITKFNVIIHECEHYMFNLDAMKLTNHPYATIVGTYNGPRYQLADEDYDHYTFKWTFGTVYINYREIGKPLLDVFKDQDDIVGDANIRPLHYYSADFQIKFGPSTLDTIYEQRVSQFDAWYESKKEHFESLGLYKDKKLALGLIPVAQLNIDDSRLKNLTKIEIVTQLSNYQQIKETKLCIK
jgi:hypothetical protein